MDDHKGYTVLQHQYHHKMVNYSIGNTCETNLTLTVSESFWTLLKRGYYGTYHHMSTKHFPRCVTELSDRFNIRNLDIVDQIAFLAKGMEGKPTSIHVPKMFVGVGPAITTKSTRGGAKFVFGLLPVTFMQLKAKEFYSAPTFHRLVVSFFVRGSYGEFLHDVSTACGCVHQVSYSLVRRRSSEWPTWV